MGVESPPVLGGRVGTGRGREGWEFIVKVLDSPAGRVSEQSNERNSEGRSQLGLDRAASERGHMSRGAPVGTTDLRVHRSQASTPPGAQ